MVCTRRIRRANWTQALQLELVDPWLVEVSNTKLRFIYFDYFNSLQAASQLLREDKADTTFSNLFIYFFIFI